MEKTSVHDRTSFLEINDSKIYFTDDWDTGIGGGLWSTGLALAKYFQLHTASVRQCVKRMAQNDEKITAIELGSGNGLLSVCLMAAAGDLISELVITDTADHLDLVSRTVRANNHISEGDCAPQVFITEHKWGESDVRTAAPGDDQGLRTYDLIVGSDLAYYEDLYEPLITSLKKLCHDRSVFLLGVTTKDTKPLFFKRLKEEGFRYTRFSD